MDNLIEKVSRRKFLRTSATIGLGMTVYGNLLFGQTTMTDDSYREETFADAMSRLFEGRIIKTQSVALQAPETAETGFTVPISIDVDYPMTDTNHIKTIYILVEKNPAPLIGKFHFSPANGKAFIATRIKMAKTSNVSAIAETNNGDLYQAIKAVKVSVGGCD